jgi:peptidoglycan/xylan/chitin deacetylase (PgdA/CDA1 family)
MTVGQTGWRAGVALLLALLGVQVAVAEDCRGNPDAIGTSRTIAVDPTEHPRVGGLNYLETLPLADKEVVLTFDDGPISPYTNKILDILAAECVRANFFIVGEMAQLRPQLVQREFNEGHTIGTHSMTHPRMLALSLDKAKAQIDDGIAATATALGDPKDLSPFFRFPGFGRTDETEDYAASHGLMVWSTDVPADDWMHISDKEIVKRAITRLERRGKGILLLHDIHPNTVRALPVLLHELKANGFHIVHVVAASPEHPKTETTPEAWLIPSRHHELPTVTLADVENGSADFLLHHRGDDLCSLQGMEGRSVLLSRAARHFPASRFARARGPRFDRFWPMRHWY